LPRNCFTFGVRKDVWTSDRVSFLSCRYSFKCQVLWTFTVFSHPEVGVQYSYDGPEKVQVASAAIVVGACGGRGVFCRSFGPLLRQGAFLLSVWWVFFGGLRVLLFFWIFLMAFFKLVVPESRPWPNSGSLFFLIVAVVKALGCSPSVWLEPRWRLPLPS